MIRASVEIVNGVEMITDGAGRVIIWPPVGAIYASRDAQGPFAYVTGEEHLIPPKPNTIS